MQRNKKRLRGAFLKVPKQVYLAGAVVLAILLVVGYFQVTRPASITVTKGTVSEAKEADSQKDESVSEKTQGIQVDIDGAVLHPGMYEITKSDPRVNDAVLAAGGLSEEAETASINLAQKIEDGTKIHIPTTGEQESTAQSATGENESSKTAGDSQAKESGTASSSAKTSESAQKTGLVNINTASAEELQTLSGIGEATAQAIIKDREQNGKFASKEDIMRVSGIGEKKYAKIESSICV